MNTPKTFDRRSSEGVEEASKESTRARRLAGRKPKRGVGTDLRRDYRLTLETGLVLSLALVVLAVRAPITPSVDSFAVNLGEQEVVQIEDIKQTVQVDRPPPPPRPPIPVEVPNDEILQDEELNLDASLDLDEPLAELPPPPPVPAAEEEVTEPEPEIFVVVEQMPEIIGGTSKVYEHVIYPAIARQAGMEGLVVIQIVVDEEGIPVSPVVGRSAGDVLDEAAIAAVMKLRFRPGRQRGKAVKVRMAIPIRFKLRDAD